MLDLYFWTTDNGHKGQVFDIINLGLGLDIRAAETGFFMKKS